MTQAPARWGTLMNGGGKPPSRTARMRDLVESYPELRTFTPDATLAEIKIRYGVNTFEQVRELGRQRLPRAGNHSAA